MTERQETVLRFDPLVYRLSAVKKAAYRLGDRCAANIRLIPGGDIEVCLTGTSDDSWADDFTREVLDQELREQILDETDDIRRVLLAHAFSGTDLAKTGPANG